MREKFVTTNSVLIIERDSDPISPREWDNLGTIVYWHPRYVLGDVYVPKDRYSSPEEVLKHECGDENDIVYLPVYLYDHSGLTINTTGFHCPWDSGQVGWIYAEKDRFLKETGYTPKALFGEAGNIEVGDYVNVIGEVNQPHFGKVEQIKDGKVLVDWTYLYSLPRRNDQNLKGEFPINMVELVTNLAKTILEDEIKTLNDYLTGNVYGYRLFQFNDNDLQYIKSKGYNLSSLTLSQLELLSSKEDSCWGFYGDYRESGLLDAVPKEFREIIIKSL